MSWYSNLKNAATGYVNDENSAYQDEMAAYLYSLECLPQPNVDRPAQELPGAQPEEIQVHANFNHVDEILNSFVAYAQSIDNECDAICQFGNDDDNSLKQFWSGQANAYRAELDKAVAFVASIPALTKPNLPQVQDERSLKAFNQQLDDYYKANGMVLNLKRRINSAKVAADILELIKQFEILAYAGQFNDARQKLLELNNYITSYAQQYYYNEFSASVFSKISSFARAY